MSGCARRAGQLCTTANPRARHASTPRHLVSGARTRRPAAGSPLLQRRAARAARSPGKDILKDEYSWCLALEVSFLSRNCKLNSLNTTIRKSKTSLWIKRLPSNICLDASCFLSDSYMGNSENSLSDQQQPTSFPLQRKILSETQPRTQLIQTFIMLMCKV